MIVYVEYMDQFKLERCDVSVQFTVRFRKHIKHKNMKN